MKTWTIKMAAALACVAALAAFGAAGASATTLCKAAESTCSAANTYKSGTTFIATGTGVRFEGSLISITCGNSTIEGSTTAASGSKVSARIDNFSFTNCQKAPGSGCSMVSGTLGYGGSFAASENGNGVFTAGQEGRWRQDVYCGSTRCGDISKSGEGIPFHFEGSATDPVISAAGVALQQTGFCFGKTVVFWGNYHISTPKPLFLES